MSRITKYLESLMSSKDKISQSKTTVSEYYTIDGIKIGVSDHFPSATNIKCDIRIVNPLNSKTVYLVQVKEGPQILQFSFKDVKMFISNYTYVKKIAGLNKEVKENRKTLASVPAPTTASVPGNRIPSTVAELSSAPFTQEGITWVNLSTIIRVDYPWFKNMSVNKKSVLRKTFWKKDVNQILSICGELDKAKLVGATLEPVGYKEVEKFLKGKGYL